MVRGILLSAALVSASLFSAPAGAVGVDAGITGDIAVDRDFSSCVTLAWSGGTVTGVFVAVGEVQGPGTKAGTFHHAVPFAASYSPMTICRPGAYEGAIAGEGRYVLMAQGAGGGHVNIEQCTVALGVVTCV